MAGVRNRIHHLLHERGMLEIDFARNIGMDQGQLNRVKNRRATPTLRTAVLIARGFGLPLEEVFCFDERAVAARRAA